MGNPTDHPVRTTEVWVEDGGVNATNVLNGYSEDL